MGVPILAPFQGSTVPYRSLSFARPPIKPEWAAETFSDLDEDVRQSIARIKASPFIPRKDQVRGFVYDVHSGELREVR